jgi:hypothetical protein
VPNFFQVFDKEGSKKKDPSILKNERVLQKTNLMPALADNFKELATLGIRGKGKGNVSKT